MKSTVPAVLACILAWILTPQAIRLAPHIGAMDIPRDSRRMHHRPIPRTGGIALYVSILLGSTLLPLPYRWLPLLSGAAVVVLLGILDDVFHLSAGVKLVAQVGAAFLAVGDFRPAGLSFLGYRLSFGPWALPLAVVWVVTLINAHNMIDGLDGLAAGVSGVEGLALGIALWQQGRQDDGAMALLMMGAILGFLPYNRHPAKVFMGDTGSQLLGLVLGTVSLRLGGEAGGLGALIPLLIFAVPLSDLIFAVVRRILRGRSPFVADRGHWHHRLCDAGVSHKRAAEILVLFSALGTGIALLLTREEALPYAAFLTLLTVCMVLAVDWGCAVRRN